MHLMVTNDIKKVREKIVHEILKALKKGDKVLWFVPGGSNIPISVEIMKKIRETCIRLHKKDIFRNLYITLTDERYGLYGHTDSNWQQLLNAGFNFSGTRTISVLQKAQKSLSLEKTTALWNEKIKKTLKKVTVCIGQFGMGSDSHIAGILPNSIAVTCEGNSDSLAVSYDAGIYNKDAPFKRITITPACIEKIHKAFLFVSGESKKVPLKEFVLTDSAVTKNEVIYSELIKKKPVQILQKVKHLYIYTDQVW